jgi:hypothetical protein
MGTPATPGHLQPYIPAVLLIGGLVFVISNLLGNR